MTWVRGLIVFGLALGSGVSFSQSKSHAHKPAGHSTVAPTHKGTSSNAKTHSGLHSKGRVRGRSARARGPAGPSYPIHPDPERYQQIQQALADRGYYKGEVNGTWNSDSVDALQRFQADQRLEDDGKISALTLRGLGLGPKHNGTGGTAPVQTPVPSAETSKIALPE